MKLLTNLVRCNTGSSEQRKEEESICPLAPVFCWWLDYEFYDSREGFVSVSFAAIHPVL